MNNISLDGTLNLCIYPDEDGLLDLNWMSLQERVISPVTLHQQVYIALNTPSLSQGLDTPAAPVFGCFICAPTLALAVLFALLFIYIFWSTGLPRCCI